MTGRVLALARITLREAFRSRFVISMLLLLAGVNILLPLLVRGDGTAIGMVNILLRYTLGASGVLLGLATLWLACGSVSLDLESRRIQHMLTKPIHTLELWFGKWLGLAALNALLLLVSYTTVFGVMQIRLAHVDFDAGDRAALATQVLQPHARFFPELDDVSEEVDQRFARIVEQGLIPEGVRKSHVRHTLARRERATRAVVGPGHSRAWVVNVPGHIDGQTALFLHANVVPPLGRLPRVEGEWRIYSAAVPTEAEALFVAPQRVYTEPRAEIPAGILRAGQSYTIQFKNLTGGQEPDSAVFGADEPVAFLQPDGRFLGSYAAALSMQFLQLAALCAFGLLCGSCLSFPVASFAAVAVLCVALIGHSVTQSLDQEIGIHSDDQERSGISRVLNHAGERLIEATEHVAGPAFGHNPLPMLADGIRVRWRDVGQAAWVLLLIYCGLPAVLSNVVLRRRELALPGSSG